MRNKWVVIFLGSMAIVLGSIGFVCYSKSAELVHNGAHTQAIVTKMVYGAKGASYPVFKFKADSGEEFEAQGSFGSNPPEFKVNDVVDVVYEKNNPKNWCANTWWDLYFLCTIFGGFSAALTLATVIVTVCSSWRRPAAESSQSLKKW